MGLNSKLRAFSSLKISKIFAFSSKITFFWVQNLEFLLNEQLVIKKKLKLSLEIYSLKSLLIRFCDSILMSVLLFDNAKI